MSDPGAEVRPVIVLPEPAATTSFDPFSVRSLPVQTAVYSPSACCPSFLGNSSGPLQHLARASSLTFFRDSAKFERNGERGPLPHHFVQQFGQGFKSEAASFPLGIFPFPLRGKIRYRGCTDIDISPAALRKTAVHRARISAAVSDGTCSRREMYHGGRL